MAACGQPPVSTARILLCRQGAVPRQEFGVLLGENVVGHDGQIVVDDSAAVAVVAAVLLQGATELQHQRRLARADGTANAHGKAAVSVVACLVLVMMVMVILRIERPGTRITVVRAPRAGESGARSRTTGRGVRSASRTNAGCIDIPQQIGESC